MLNWLPGLSTIKSWLLGGLAIAATTVFGLWQMSRAGRIKDKIKGLNQARKTEKKVNKAALEGLQNEQDEINNIKSERKPFN